MCPLSGFPHWRGVSGGAGTLPSASVADAVCGLCLGASPPHPTSVCFHSVVPDGDICTSACRHQCGGVTRMGTRLQGLPLSSRRKPSSGAQRLWLRCHGPHELSLPGSWGRPAGLLALGSAASSPASMSPHALCLMLPLSRAQPQSLPRPPSPGAGPLLFCTCHAAPVPCHTTHSPRGQLFIDIAVYVSLVKQHREQGQ